MQQEKKQNKDKVNVVTILTLYWFIVVVAKVIRYTILKKTLVYMSIGNGWVGNLVQRGNHFIISLEGDSVASENSKALFQIFSCIGLNTYIDYETIITIIWNVIFLIIIMRLKDSFSLTEAIFLVMSIAVLNIWDFCLAKEPLQMMFFVVIYFILISKIKNNSLKYILSLGVILFSCFTYRNYYILIVAFSIVSYITLNNIILKKNKVEKKDIAFILLVYAIVYSVVIIYCQYCNQEAYDAFMYFNQRVTTATTDLASIFHSNFLPIIAVDYLLLVVRMLFPIELIRFGPQYMLYAIYQMMVSYFVIKSILNLKNNHQIKNMALYLYIGFLFASATFEPDFGSWVRHEAVVLPIILIIADLVDFNKYENRNGVKNGTKKHLNNY